MTYDEIMDRVHREVRTAARWGSAIYPCAVALTDDQKWTLLSEAPRRSGPPPFDAAGNLQVLGLAVAVVPDTWKGPMVLLAQKEAGR